MRLVLAALLVAVLVAGCNDKGQTYSRSDVERAFSAQGLELLAPTGEDHLAPMNASEEFVVLIYPSEKKAADALRIFKSQASSESFDVQKGNVLVTSDDGVTAPMRIRINAALFQLS